VVVVEEVVVLGGVVGAPFLEREKERERGF
jgi:hypothetical protein